MNDIDNTPCPDCGAIATLSIALRLVAEPIGAHGVSGTRIKTTARTRPVLTCAACGLSLPGEIEGQHAVFSPSGGSQRA